MDVNRVADRLIERLNQEYEEISPMRLQKLLYFAQGLSLAEYKRPLFEENFENWKNGPVIRPIYRRFKGYGREDIPEEAIRFTGPLDSDDEMILNKTLEIFGRYNAYQLSDLSHQGFPWKNLYPVFNQNISKESMYRYFSTHFYDTPEFADRMESVRIEFEKKQLEDEIRALKEDTERTRYYSAAELHKDLLGES